MNEVSKQRTCKIFESSQLELPNPGFVNTVMKKITREESKKIWKRQSVYFTLALFGFTFLLFSVYNYLPIANFNFISVTNRYNHEFLDFFHQVKSLVVENKLVILLLSVILIISNLVDLKLYIK